MKNMGLFFKSKKIRWSLERHIAAENKTTIFLIYMNFKTDEGN